MRAAVAGWLTQLVMFAAVDRSVVSAVMVLVGLPIAAWSMHSAINMGREATAACVVMALGTSMWHIDQDMPLVLATLFAWAFLMPLVWRSAVVR